jgi:predicted peptidase
MFKKQLTLLFAASMICLLTVFGSSGGSADASSQSTQSTPAEIAKLEKSWLITNVYGDGQKPWIVVLEYSEPIDASSVAANDFSMETYEIDSVYVNDKAEVPESSADGAYVLL